MSHVEFTRTTPDGQELYYQGWAPEGEPKAVVCLVHGLGEHSGRYAYVGRTVNDAGYALLSFDQRGHGKTPGPRGVTPPFEAVLDDITRLLEKAADRFPGRPQFLCGQSMGGAWVLNYAIKRQPAIAGAIVSSPMLRAGFKPPAAKVAAGKVLYRVAPNVVLPNGLDLTTLCRDPEVVREYTTDPLVHDRMSARLALDLIRQGEWALAHAAEFPPIPLLIFHGTSDRITSALASEEFATKCLATGKGADGAGTCTLKLWPGCYHEMHNEPQKDEVLRYMIDWLNDRLHPAEHPAEQIED